MNQKDGWSATVLDVVEFHRTRLLFAVFVFDFYCFSDLGDRHSGIVQLSRIQRDILAHRSTRAVPIGETVQIVLVTVRQFAPAIALQLLQNLRNIQRGLVRLPCFADKHRGGQRF